MLRSALGSRQNRLPATPEGCLRQKSLLIGYLAPHSFRSCGSRRVGCRLVRGRPARVGDPPLTYSQPNPSRRVAGGVVMSRLSAYATCSVLAVDMLVVVHRIGKLSRCGSLRYPYCVFIPRFLFRVVQPSLSAFIRFPSTVIFPFTCFCHSLSIVLLQLHLRYFERHPFLFLIPYSFMILHHHHQPLLRLLEAAWAAR